MKKTLKLLLTLFLSVCILGTCTPGVLPFAAWAEEKPLDLLEDFDDSELTWFDPNEIERKQTTITNSTVDTVIQKSLPADSAVSPENAANQSDPAKNDINTIATDNIFNSNATPINSTTPDLIYSNITLDRFSYSDSAPVHSLYINGTANDYSLYGGSFSGLNSLYPANQTVAGMASVVPSLSLEPNEAAISLTVDNFWIADRTPATERNGITSRKSSWAETAAHSCP